MSGPARLADRHPGGECEKTWGMSHTKIAAPALICLFLLSSCATGPSQNGSFGGLPPESGTGESTAQEEREYRDITTLYSRGAYEAALLKLQTFERNHSKSGLFSQAENLHGLCDLLTKRPAQAIPHFQKAIATGDANPSLTQYLLYNLADAQFEAGQLDDAQKTAARIGSTEDMDKDNRIKVHYLKARIASKKGAPSDSARECLMAGKALLPSSNRDTRTAVSALLEQNLMAIQDPLVIEDLFHGYEDSSLSDQVLFRLGSLELTAPAPGSKEKGQGDLQLLLTRYPDSIYYAQANELLHGGSATGTPAGGLSTSDLVAAGHDNGPVNSMAIGVLLPMKGKFAKFGARTLQGVELAFRIFNEKEPDAKITLVVQDSGEETESTLRALNKLVSKHHVVAVIGPLLTKGIDQVTARAQELGVPLLSLARHSGTQGDYIFQAGLTLRLQANEIARYAFEKLGIKRFAVVYPRDKVGEESMQRFWDAVEAMGGTITGVESYNPGDTDFRQPIDKLSGLYYTEARTRELEDLAKQRELNNIKKRTRHTEQYFSLKPVIDYEAVFIPEEPKVAGQILPTFAYRDVDKIKFLGTSAWNSPELATRAMAASENAFFLDAFSLEDTSLPTRRYIEKYRATFGQDPTQMDALAYDAARLLESVLSKEPGLSRADLRDRLKEIKRFPGVTGTLTYHDGYFMRDLKILTVSKQGKIIQASNEVVAPAAQ